MRELTTREARKEFATVVNRAAFARERFVLTRCGKPLAAVVSLADLAQLEQAAAVVRTSAIILESPPEGGKDK